eukprot:TRINITY_DN4624_c0_g2_i1.p1 TRINITY_DN4624_c0_g2~~TRINITY_DN4624_c0_g2_i1.p1  ORF type:complete len:870 (-),score=280.12 TRINITY_DN4624_c0_g2_i1:153-2762(-)
MEKGAAIKLVELTPEGEFRIPDKAMNLLQEMGDKRVAPVVIAGPWRSGKSFLANRLLGQMKGFAIGSTVKACTKGIWMWSQPLKLPNEDAYALILDAEGLNSTERSTNTDTKLFALSLLLSSLFVYNSRGHITETSIEDLSVVVSLTQHIHIKKTDAESGLDFHKYFPTFFWVLRDFSLDLKKRSAREYLEDNLKPQPATDEEGTRKNAIRQTISSFFLERDCFTLVRPVNEESKIAHIEDMKYRDLRPEFTKACDSLIQKILGRARVKTVNGTPLTASMFMGLALEYTQSLNDHEAPTILTALERVLLDEARKHTEHIFEGFASKLGERAPASAMPMEEEDLALIIDQCRLEAAGELIRELHELCSPSDLTSSYDKFEARIKIEVEKTMESNAAYSEGRCKELLQSLSEKLALPKIQTTTDVKPTLMLEYTSGWSKLIDDYYNHAKGPAKDAVLADFIKNKVLASLGDLLKDVMEVYGESESKLQLHLTELQVSEKKWKTLFENNERILVERSKEKDELMTKSSEFELKNDQLQRELRAKESSIKSLKNSQLIEVANLKQLNDTVLREKELLIDNLTKRLGYMTDKIGDIEDEKEKLQSKYTRNNSIILEQSMDEGKSKYKSNQQTIVSTLYKNIKTGLDEFKVLLEGADDVSRLKRQILDLQREVNDKEFMGNKKLLEMRKEVGNQITELKLKHENETQILVGEVDSLKQTNVVVQEKLAQAENKIKILGSRVDGMQNERALLEENIKIKEELIQQYKTSLEQETKKAVEESNMRQDIEMQLSKTKVEWALLEDDTESLLDYICMLAEKYSKKRLSIKDTYGKIRNERVKTAILERLTARDIKNDIYGECLMLCLRLLGVEIAESQL